MARTYSDRLYELCSEMEVSEFPSATVELLHSVSNVVQEAEVRRKHRVDVQAPAYRFTTGQYKTTGGATAIVYLDLSRVCGYEDEIDRYPLIGVYQDADSEWEDTRWTANGEFYHGESDNEFDLVAPTEHRHTRYEVTQVVAGNGLIISSDTCVSLEEARGQIKRSGVAQSILRSGYQGDQLVMVELVRPEEKW